MKDLPVYSTTELPLAGRHFSSEISVFAVSCMSTIAYLMLIYLPS